MEHNNQTNVSNKTIEDANAYMQWRQRKFDAKTAMKKAMIEMAIYADFDVILAAHVFDKAFALVDYIVNRPIVKCSGLDILNAASSYVDRTGCPQNIYDRIAQTKQSPAFLATAKCLALMSHNQTPVYFRSEHGDGYNFRTKEFDCAETTAKYFIRDCIDFNEYEFLNNSEKYLKEQNIDPQMSVTKFIYIMDFRRLANQCTFKKACSKIDYNSEEKAFDTVCSEFDHDHKTAFNILRDACR